MEHDINGFPLIRAWVQLSGMLKNSRFTKELPYNESIVMMLLYERYTTDGNGMLSLKEITAQTRMLKSQVNRTVNSLEEKGLLQRCEADGDKRIAYVRCVAEKLDIFLEVHHASLQIARQISDIIGPEDTESFIRIVNKLESAGYSL